MLDFKIPKAPGVMRAMGDFLIAEAEFCGGVPFPSHSAGPLPDFHFSTTEALDEHVKKRADELGLSTARPEEGFVFPNADVLDEYVKKRSGELGLGPYAPHTCTCLEAASENQTAGEEIEKGPTPPAIDTPAVELAGEPAIPWDARIHAGSKAKYSKAPHGWKLKRGVDPALVATVETELLGALAASPANPVTTEPSAEVVFGTDQGPTPPTNFVELNLAITGAGITTEKVEDAIKAAGLANYMLLPTRPDLIPFVAGQLGLGPVIEAPAS